MSLRQLNSLSWALLSNKSLTQESFTEMTTVQAMFDGSDNPQAYALGWRHYETRLILGDHAKVDVIHHGGRAFGADSFFMLVPAYNICVAVMTNGQGEKSRVEIQKLAYRLAGIVIEQKLEAT